MPSGLALIFAQRRVVCHPSDHALDHGTPTFLSFVESLLLLVTYSWGGMEGLAKWKKKGRETLEQVDEPASMGNKVREGGQH